MQKSFYIYKDAINKAKHIQTNKKQKNQIKGGNVGTIYTKQKLQKAVTDW